MNDFIESETLERDAGTNPRRETPVSKSAAGRGPLQSRSASVRVTCGAILLYVSLIISTVSINI
jgi:hypothetical protein